MNPLLPNPGDLILIVIVSLVLSMLIKDVPTLMITCAFVGAGLGFWRANKNSEDK